MDNWSRVLATPPVLVDVGHETWIEGPGDGYDVPSQPADPLTITGHYGRGKILFTSSPWPRPRTRTSG